jgi:tetratricopeptide (TPR) repeat protein
MALFNLALAFERLKKYDDALGAIRRALEIEPGDVSLQKLEFRVRLLKLRARFIRAIRSLWPFRAESGAI